MANNVYSTRFLELVNGIGPVTYTVPAGYVIVVRHIDVTLRLAIASVVGFRVDRVGGAIIQEFLYPPNQEGSETWDGHQVLQPGEQLRAAYLSGSGWDCMISGYILALP